MDFHFSVFWFRLHSNGPHYVWRALILGYILTTVTRSISTLSRNLRTTFHASLEPGYRLSPDYPLFCLRPFLEGGVCRVYRYNGNSVWFEFT